MNNYSIKGQNTSGTKNVVSGARVGAKYQNNAVQIRCRLFGLDLTG